MLRFHLKKVASTNDWAKESIADWHKDGLTLFTAEEQTKGRGKGNRSWITPPGSSIAATFTFFLKEESFEATQLVQLLAKAAVSVLEKKGFHAIIKWPNDLLIAGKKLAGILCETIADPNSPELIGIVMGIGLNVNVTKEELLFVEQPTTSLFQESSKLFDIEELIQDLSAELQTALLGHLIRY